MARSSGRTDSIIKGVISIDRETDKAFLLKLEVDGVETSYWFPKSQVELYVDPATKEQQVFIPAWLASSKDIA